MQLFGLDIADGVHKRWCRFMIHRYLGQLLEQNLALDQLSVELPAGKLAVNEVKINSQYVNDFLASRNVPLTLTDGFVGRIIIEVPWISLLSQPSKITLHQLELTLQLERDPKRGGEELELSVLGSIVDSLPSSDDLARSFCESVEQANPDSDVKTEDGVKAITEIIEAIISRVGIELSETTLRLESPLKSDSHLCTAVEVRLKDIHFMDGMHGKDGSTVNTSSLPHEREVMGRKCIDMSGVEFFTDVFTATEDGFAEQRYFRGDEQKVMSSSFTTYSSMPTVFYSFPSSSTANFYSSYSTSNARINQIGNRYPGYKEGSDRKLLSKPIKFAELVGESHMIFCTRMSNVSANKKDKKLEVELLCKGFHCFISPSQIRILESFFSSIALLQDGSNNYGRKMGKSDYEVITKNLEQAIRRTNLTTTVQSNEAESEHQKFQGMVSINLEDDAASRKFSSVHGTFAENSAKASVSLKVELETVLVYIPHNDILSLDYVKSLANGHHEALDQISKEAEAFFAKSTAVSLKHCSLNASRSMLDDLYFKDHLRIAGSSVVFSYQTGNTECEGLIEAKLVFPQVDLIEFLTAESNPVAGENIHIPLLDFAEIVVDDREPPLKIMFETTSDTVDKSSIIICIGKCHCELDPSMVDRVADLLAPRPFFDSLLDRTLNSRVTVRNESPQLCEDHLNPSTTQQLKEIKLTISCAAFELRVRIPMSDFPNVPAAETTFRKRHVHPEYIDLLLKSPVVEIAFGDGTALVELLADDIEGSLCGILNELTSSQKNYQVLWMSQTANEPLHIKLQYVPRNKSVLCDTEMSDSGNGINGVLDDSLSSPVINTVTRREGPFAHTHRSAFQNGQEENNLVTPGSREEMEAFGADCILKSMLVITLDIPLFRVFVWSHAYLELLYNRIVSGLLLWQPTARATALNEDFVVNVLSDEVLIKDQHEKELDPSVCLDVFERSKPHLLSLTLNLRRASAMCVAEENEGDGKGLSAHMTNAQFFFVAGYRGNMSDSYAYFTTHTFSLESGKVDSVPSSSNFGEWSDEVHAYTIPGDDEFSSHRNVDAFVIAIHLREQPDQDAKDMLLAIALRNICLQIRPFQNLEETWMLRLAHLFGLQNYCRSDNELPAVKTEFHMHLDNVLLAYDHAWTKPDSTIRLKLVIGEADINSLIAQDMDVAKITSSFESVGAFINNIRKPDDNAGEEQNGHYCSNQKEFSKVVDIGLFQFECNYTCGVVETEKKTPLLDFRGLNGTIEVWICADTLATMLNIATEISDSQGYATYANKEVYAHHSADRDIMKDCYNGSYSSLAKRSKKVKRLLVSAMKESAACDCQCGTSAKRAEHFADPSSDSPWTGRTRAHPQNDDGFCVLDTDDTGTINSASKPHIKYIGTQAHPDISVDIDYQHFPFPRDCDEFAALLAKSSTPTMRYLIRDVSISLHLYTGSALDENLLETCSCSCNRRENLYKNRIITGDEHHEKPRDRRVVLELSKITYVYQVFGEKAPFMSIMFLAIHDMTLLDRSSAGRFKKLLYQYSSAQQPRRTYAPMLAVRIMVSHRCEGKMRISMLPIKFSIDQDTMDFLKDFLQEVTESSTDVELKPPESDRDKTFIKEFIFSPSVPIYVDYHGKNRVSMEKDGAVVGVLAGFGHLHHAEFVLNEIVYRNGLLGVSRCFSAAMEEWLSNIIVFPNVLASFGPVKPIYQIAKAVVDLFLLPAAELWKQDGHPIKGLQKGFKSFGQSSASGVAGVAHTFVRIVQALTGPAFQKLQP